MVAINKITVSKASENHHISTSYARCRIIWFKCSSCNLWGSGICLPNIPASQTDSDLELYSSCKILIVANINYNTFSNLEMKRRRLMM